MKPGSRSNPARRTGSGADRASGPLVWFTRFADLTLMNDADVETWLAMQVEGEGGSGR
jgi:hypothetical protein